LLELSVEQLAAQGELLETCGIEAGQWIAGRPGYGR
jgi:hypothetical protein